MFSLFWRQNIDTFEECLNNLGTEKPLNVHPTFPLAGLEHIILRDIQKHENGWFSVSVHTKVPMVYPIV